MPSQTQTSTNWRQDTSHSPRKTLQHNIHHNYQTPPSPPKTREFTSRFPILVSTYLLSSIDLSSESDFSNANFAAVFKSPNARAVIFGFCAVFSEGGVQKERGAFKARYWALLYLLTRELGGQVCMHACDSISQYVWVQTRRLKEYWPPFRIAEVRERPESSGLSSILALLLSVLHRLCKCVSANAWRGVSSRLPSQTLSSIAITDTIAARKVPLHKLESRHIIWSTKHYAVLQLQNCLSMTPASLSRSELAWAHRQHRHLNLGCLVSSNFSPAWQENARLLRGDAWAR